MPASKIIASALLLCALGSLLWCADACRDPTGNADGDCTCLLGGLLAAGAPVSDQGSLASPPAQPHDACRCLCQCVTLTVVPFLPAVYPTSFPISIIDQRICFAPTTKDISHPPRLS